MTALRFHLLRHRGLAAGLIVLAMALRMLVPGGYMIGGSAGAITIELCSGHAPRTMVMAMPGMAHHSDKHDGDHGKAEMPCAFAGLAAPSLAAADPLLLVAAIAFILLTVYRRPSNPARAGVPPRLRPPLRGPPLPA